MLRARRPTIVPLFSPSGDEIEVPHNRTCIDVQGEQASFDAVIRPTFANEQFSLERDGGQTDAKRQIGVCDARIPQQLACGSVNRNDMAITGAPEQFAFIERHASAGGLLMFGILWDIGIYPNLGAGGGIECERLIFCVDVHLTVVDHRAILEAPYLPKLKYALGH